MGGDLMTTSRRFPFSVEVKNQCGWTLNRVLAGAQSVVWSWWIQCQDAAREADQVPMLWIREARYRGQPWLIMLPYHYAVTVPIKPPLQAWSRTDLLSRHHGPLLPVLFKADVILGLHPLEVALEDKP